MSGPVVIDASLARRLIDSQFPQWSQLSITAVEFVGWDNRTFRLGSELAVRLPSGVQNVIDDVHSKYASVSGARAEVSRARYEDARNKILAKTYQQSPALARIHAIRSAPKGATIIINDGEGRAPGLNLGGGG